MNSQFRASVLWRALKSPSPQLPKAQPLALSPGAILPPQIGGGVSPQGCAMPCKVCLPWTALGATKDDRLGCRGLTELFQPGQAPRSHGTVCSHSLLPPPFLPRVQGRKLAPASGTRSCPTSAGAEDGTEGRPTGGTESLGTSRWPEGEAAGRKPTPVAPLLSKPS